MLSKFKVHWHVVVAAFLAALPELLNALGVIDLRPILSPFIPANYVDLIVGCLPFVLAFLRPIVTREPEA